MNLSPEDIAVAQNVIQAVEAHTSPYVSESERMGAMTVIENFQRDPMSLRISLHMIHSSNDPEVRHFGYSVLDSHVKSQWVILDEHKKLSSALNDDQKIQIKNALLEEIYLMSIKDIQYIKEKAALVLVDITEKELFTNWNNLIPYLMDIAQQTDKSEMFFIIFRTLIEQIASFPINLWKVAVDNILDDLDKTILPYLYSQLNHHYSSLQQHGDGIETEQIILSRLVIKESLRCLTSLSNHDWVPLRYFLESHQIVDALFHLMKDPLFCESASDVLVALFEKEDPSKPEFVLKYGANIETIVEQIPNIQSEDDLQYIRRVFQTVSLICCFYISYGEQEPVKVPVPRILELMLDISKHKSYVISSLSFPFWAITLKSKHVLESPNFNEIYRALYKSITEKMKRRPADDPSLSMEEKLYRQFDFHMETDFSEFLSKYRTLFKNSIFLKVSKTQPLLTLDCFFEQLNELVVLHKMAETDSTYFPNVERSAKLIKQMLVNYVQVFIKTNIRNESFRNVVQHMFDMVQFNACSEIVLISQLYLISIFAPLVVDDPSVTQSIVHKMISLCIDDSKTYSKKLRYISCNRLLYISNKMQKHLAAIIPNLVGLFNASNNLDFYEREKIMSTIVTIGNSHYLKKHEYKELIDHLIPQMIPQVRDLLSVATKKIDFLNSFALLTPLSSDGVKKRIECQAIISQTRIIWCNTKEDNLFSEYNELVLNTSYEVLKLISDLYAPESMSDMSLRPLFSFNHNVAESWIKKEKIITEDVSPDIGNFLFHLSKNCILLISHFFVQTQPFMDGIVEMLLNLSFGIKNMPIFMWIPLLSILSKSSFLSIPKDIVAEYLSRLLESLAFSLCNEWTRVDDGFYYPELEVVITKAISQAIKLSIEICKYLLLSDDTFSILNGLQLSRIIQYLSILVEKSDSVSCIAALHVLNNVIITRLGNLIITLPSQQDESLLRQQALRKSLIEFTLPVAFSGITKSQKTFKPLSRYIVSLYKHTKDIFRTTLNRIFPKAPVRSLDRLERHLKLGRQSTAERGLKAFLNHLGSYPQQKDKPLDIPLANFHEYTSGRQNTTSEFFFLDFDLM